MLSQYVAIGLGGALGAILRVLLARTLPSHVYLTLPFQIFAVNLLGCFLMGILAEVMSSYWEPHPTLRLFLVSGLLGGFTTFSAFAYEFGLLAEKNTLAHAATYAAVSVVSSILLIFAGMKIVRVVVG